MSFIFTSVLFCFLGFLLPLFHCPVSALPSFSFCNLPFSLVPPSSGLFLSPSSSWLSQDLFRMSSAFNSFHFSYLVFLRRRSGRKKNSSFPVRTENRHPPHMPRKLDAVQWSSFRSYRGGLSASKGALSMGNIHQRHIAWQKFAPSKEVCLWKHSCDTPALAVCFQHTGRRFFCIPQTANSCQEHRRTQMGRDEKQPLWFHFLKLPSSVTLRVQS